MALGAFLPTEAWRERTSRASLRRGQRSDSATNFANDVAKLFRVFLFFVLITSRASVC